MTLQQACEGGCALTQANSPLDVAAQVALLLGLVVAASSFVVFGEGAPPLPAWWGSDGEETCKRLKLVGA